ncbi:MAG: hypothetical protein OEW75_06435 [Cyclobacteriaceae bacterium]|nr:hypothetical protein [Cyclobacteriaceae bacterium]
MDTLNAAIIQSYAKQFKSAADLLNVYTKNHHDPEAWRWYALILYWNGNLKSANTAYIYLHEHFPDYQPGLFDYGKFLYETGKLMRAEKVLYQYVQNQPDNLEAQIMLFYLESWAGKTAQATQRLNKLSTHYSENKEVRTAKEYLKLLHGPFFEILTSSTSDDQPLKYSFSEIGSKWYYNRFIHPEIEFQHRRNKLPTGEIKNNEINVKNAFQLNPFMNFLYSGGLFSNSNSQFFTYTFSGKFKPVKPVYIELFIAKKPYQYSISSVSNPFYEKQSGLKGGFNSKKGTLLEITYRQDNFPDNNTIYNAFGWVLFPILKEETFKLNAGYSFSYSTSDYSTYKEDTSPAPGPFRGPPFLKKGVIYTGYYDLYFTPKNQKNNMILTQMHIGNDINYFSVNHNFSLSSFTDVPQGTNGTGEIQYNTSRYKPLETSFKLQFKIQGPVSLYGSYKYQRLYFYQIQTATLGLLVDFTKNYAK